MAEIIILIFIGFVIHIGIGVFAELISTGE